MKEFIKMIEDDWIEKYNPIVFNDPDDATLKRYETYGDDFNYIMSLNPCYVWTAIDGDDGNIYMVNGVHYVNRLYYIKAKNPWNDGEDIEALYSEMEDLGEEK